jgi:sortase A
MKRLAYVLIMAGLMTMSYPKGKSMYFSYLEQQMLKEWESADASLVQRSLRQLDDVFLGKGKAEAQNTSPDRDDRTIGKLVIHKIDLTLPILQGASQANLKLAAGLLNGTSPLGEQGNSALAAHRSYTYGKQFNRLPEVEPGDTIEVATKDKKLTYEVIEEFIVIPGDLSVLKKDDKRSILTLITCHPMKNPTHRYIVKAVLQKEEAL